MARYLLGLFVLLAATGTLPAQITTDERTIEGSIGFTNTVFVPPDVPENVCDPVTARSVGLADPFNNTGCVLGGTTLVRDYSVVAQVFDNGVYWISAPLGVGPQTYRFGYAANTFSLPGYPNFVNDVYVPVTAAVTPVSPDPVGSVDLLECAGRINVRFVEPDGGGGFISSSVVGGGTVSAYPRQDPLDAIAPYAYRSGSVFASGGGAQAQRNFGGGGSDVELFVRSSSQAGGPDVRYRVSLSATSPCTANPICPGEPFPVPFQVDFEGLVGAFGAFGSGGAASSPGDNPGIDVVCDGTQDVFVEVPSPLCGCPPPSGSVEGCVNLIAEPETFFGLRTLVRDNVSSGGGDGAVSNLGGSPVPFSSLFTSFDPANSEGIYFFETPSVGTRVLQSYFSLNDLAGGPQNLFDSETRSIAAPDPDTTITGTDFCLVPGIYQGTATLRDATSGGFPSGALANLNPNNSFLFAFGSSGGTARRDFRSGSYSATTGIRAVPYENVFGNPDQLTRTWTQPRITDEFSNSSTDPASFVQGGSRIEFTQPTGSVLFDPLDYTSTGVGGLWTLALEPGTEIAERSARTFPVDYELCYSTLRIQVNTQGTQFFDPLIGQYTGSFTDDLGTPSVPGDDMIYGVFARGNWLGSPTDSADASTEGFVNLQLPQGNYTGFGGQITTVLGPGLFGTTELPTIDAALGCGESCTATPNAILCLSPIAGCNDADIVATDQVEISGTLNHSLDIASGSYRINDGAQVPIDVVAAGITCGPTPCADAFTVTVAGFQPCRNRIEITFADSGGNPISAFLGTTIDSTDPLFVSGPDPGPAGTPYDCGGEVRFSPPGNCFGGISPTALDLPVAADSCSAEGDPDSPLIVTNDGPATYPFGTTVVNFSAVDSCGNGATCQTTIVIEDTTPPAISCSPNGTLELPADGDCTALFTVAANVADNCDTAQQTTVTHRVTFPDASLQDGVGDQVTVDFPLGISSVSFTATDSFGNTSGCVSTIEVVDNTPPDLFCPEPVDPGACLGAPVILPHFETLDIMSMGETHFRAFDVDQASIVSIQTDSIDSNTDTQLGLLIGCDDAGDIFSTGISDDDGGAGFLSNIVACLPPADDVLGNTTVDADWIVEVGAVPPAIDFDLSITILGTGYCNEPNTNFSTACFTDQDCIDQCGGSFPCNGAPIPGLPPCIPCDLLGGAISPPESASATGSKSGGDSRGISDKTDSTIQYKTKLLALNAVGDGASTESLGIADTCLAGDVNDAPTTVLAGPGDLFVDSPVTIDIGDHDWYTFNVNPAGPGQGWNVRIETVSDDPGGFSDDTDLTLWEDCSGTGSGVGLLAFSEDSALANAPFMSRIDTQCLTPGDKYIEVGGFFDIVGADNIDVEIEVTGNCLIDDLYADTCLPGEVDDSPTAVLNNAGDVFAAAPMSIDPAGDHDWFSFDVDPLLPGFGWKMRIETMSAPGTIEGDTELSLFAGCDLAGNGVNQIGYSDDSPLASGPFMSRIDSQCLEAGTYYVDVSAFSSLDMFDGFGFEIEAKADCFATDTSAIFECDQPGGLFVELITNATDNCGIASESNSQTGATLDASDTYPIGETAVIFTVVDTSGNVTECSAGIEIIDLPPTISCPAAATLFTTDVAGLSINDGDVNDWLESVSAADSCGNVTIVHDAPPQFPTSCDPGGVPTTVTFTATDEQGKSLQCSSDLTIVLSCDDGDACTADTCDPILGCVNVDVSDSCDDGLGCTTNFCDAEFGCEVEIEEECVNTIGFYKRLCAGPHPEDELIQADADCVNDSLTFSSVASVDDICDVLHPDPESDKCEQGESQLMALLLNECKGYAPADQQILSLCSTNQTVGQAISEADVLLSDPLRTDADCTLAQCIADEINTGDALGAFRIRLDRAPGDGVRVTWNQPIAMGGFAGGETYLVWRRESTSAPFELLGETTEMFFDDLTHTSGVDYEYEVTFVRY